MEKVFIQIGTNDGDDEFNQLVRQNNGMYIVEEFLKSKGFTINNIGQDTIASR